MSRRFLYVTSRDVKVERVELGVELALSLFKLESE
jgi:hypothetical protein